MTVYKHKNGYYCYNFMYRRTRYCRSFKGLTYEEVKLKEMEHKLTLHNITVPQILFPNLTDTSKSNKNKHTWEEAVADYKSYAYSHYTKPEAAFYIVDQFEEIVKGVPLEDIKPKHIDEYINIRKQQVKPSTINRELNTIRKIFTLAVQNELLEKSPAKGLKNLRTYSNPNRFLSKQEEAKLLKACTPVMRCIVKVAIYTGLRKNEILSLKWVDINLKEGYLIARETKNSKAREIPICPILYEVFKSLPQVGEYIFMNPHTGDRYQDVYCNFKRAVKKSRIDHITFHQLRHTTASRLNELGIDIITIKEILGHANIKTTQRYTHNRNEDKIRAMRKLGSL